MAVCTPPAALGFLEKNKNKKTNICYIEITQNTKLNVI